MWPFGRDLDRFFKPAGPTSARGVRSCYKFSLAIGYSIKIIGHTSRNGFAMHSNILSLICILYVLLISCAARVVVRDAVSSDIAVPTTGTDTPAIIYDKVIPSKVRALGRNAAESQITPLVGALWQTGIHQIVSPSRANNRANEPDATPFAGAFWQMIVHEEITSKRSAVQHAEGPVYTHVPGLLFQSAVHEKISDSKGKQ